MSPIRSAPRKESLIDRIGLEIQVIGRLFLDRNMPLWLKLIPLASLAFLVNPVDFPGILDDLIVVLVALIVFYEFAPAGLAAQHRQELRLMIDTQWREDNAKKEKIIDGQFRESDHPQDNDQQNGGG